jgi:hypothetical protein
MTKSLRSYPKSERRAVIIRRLKENMGGLGYLAARDADKLGALVAVKDTPSQEPQATPAIQADK